MALMVGNRGPAAPSDPDDVRVRGPSENRAEQDAAGGTAHGDHSDLALTAAIFVWGTVSGRLERDDLTAPIVFVAVGGLLAALHVVDAPSAAATFKVVVEATLVWVLFSDAAGVPFRDIRHDLGRIGWFGPRGLASLVFALLALEELGAAAASALSIIGLTVLMSVVAHSFTTRPLATRYGGGTSGHCSRRTNEQPR